MGRGVSDYKRYFLGGIILVLLFLSYKIIQHYIVALLSGFILAYILKPVYFLFNRKLGKKISAFLCVLIMILIILVPIAVVLKNVSVQAFDFFSEENINLVLEKVSSLPILEKFGISSEGFLDNATSFLLNMLSSLFGLIPSLIISIIILLMAVFFMLIYWKDITNYLKSLIPFKDSKEVSAGISKVTKSILYGFGLIAVISFIISGIGFYFSGVGPYLLLAFFIFIFAFIPGIGPTFIWIPMALYYYFMNNMYTFIGVLITGIVLSFFIDTLLRIKILGDKAEINSLIMLMGILGGVPLFGIFGVVIGPLILIYSIELVKRFSD